MKVAHLLLITCVVVSGGCFLIDHRKVFEEVLNGAIGQPVDQSRFYRPHWVQKLESGHIEHGFKDSYRGCSYAVEVDEKTRIILSWRYLSEPRLCWKHVPTA